MAYKLTNKGPQIRVVYDKNQRAVTLQPGDSKTANLDEHTATTIHIDAANGDTLKIQPLGAAKASEPKTAAPPPPAPAPSVGKAEQAPLPEPEEPVGEPEQTEASPPPAPAAKASRRAPQGRGRETPARALIREVEGGMSFFDLRRRAKELLGEDWPGGHASKADILNALERHG